MVSYDRSQDSHSRLEYSLIPSAEVKRIKYDQLTSIESAGSARMLNAGPPMGLSGTQKYRVGFNLLLLLPSASVLTARLVLVWSIS
jgi:hypothetical protein